MSTEQQKEKIGTILKVHRKKLGFSQKDIADRLKLRLFVIQSIEENQFTSSQAVTFIRGYLRSYAKVIGLDESIVSYALKNYGEIQYQEYRMLSFSKKTKQDRRDSWIMMLTWGIFSMIIAISFFWWWQQKEQSRLAVTLGDNTRIFSSTQETGQLANNSHFTNIMLSSNVLDEPTIEKMVVSKATNNENLDEFSSIKELDTSLELALVKDELFPISLESRDKKILTMSFQSDCWIQVKDSSGRLLSTGIKKAGHNLELISVLPLNIILGVPESVSMTFAGKSIDLSRYTSGKVARFTLA
ncbi:hypothetical protein CF66_9016 [Candidatus Photodesmus katoptron]|uniref:RodZ domain-containing protein n=1 Tax=Candidatus Photodesmus anomalopis TaxID=28176 RepID=UPI0004D5C61B|nr:RodZ domain-containing protein [Candidatus Photodesmus katoptron]KEY89986.1 hypothetical protein CF66_9016 [Candidatus Photodesmus katoptron]